jgi:hypothetical protein
MKRSKAAIMHMSFMTSFFLGRFLHSADGVDLGGVHLNALVTDHEA